MKPRHTLESFFRLHEDKAIDFHVRADFSNEKYSFYIHPANLNGETWHFKVNGNALEFIYPSTPEEQNQEFLSVIKQLEARIRDLEEFQRDYETRELEQRDCGE